MIRYRSEAFAGSRERDAVEVMRYETFELGNVDILDTLAGTLLKDHPISKEIDQFIRELDENGYVDDFTEQDGRAFMRRVLDAVNSASGLNVRYALWLADKETVLSMYYGAETEMDPYETGPVVLSDLGLDGTLYGYENFPASLPA